MSFRTPPEITSIGMPSRNASPIPLIAWVRPAAGTTASTRMVSDTRLTASAMNAAPPSWLTSKGWIEFEAANSSYSSMLWTPGIPNVYLTPICSNAWRTSHAAVFFISAEHQDIGQPQEQSHAHDVRSRGKENTGRSGRIRTQLFKGQRHQYTGDAAGNTGSGHCQEHHQSKDSRLVCT